MQEKVKYIYVLDKLGGVEKMELYVDQDLCIACGACISLCPEVYDWNDEDKAHVIVDEVPEDSEETAVDAMDSCPTEAIKEK